jgi:hypothetical protein
LRVYKLARFASLAPRGDPSPRRPVLARRRFLYTSSLRSSGRWWPEARAICRIFRDKDAFRSAQEHFRRKRATVADSVVEALFGSRRGADGERRRPLIAGAALVVARWSERPQKIATSAGGEAPEGAVPAALRPSDEPHAAA